MDREPLKLVPISKLTCRGSYESTYTRSRPSHGSRGSTSRIEEASPLPPHVPAGSRKLCLSAPDRLHAGRLLASPARVLSCWRTHLLRNAEWLRCDGVPRRGHVWPSLIDHPNSKKPGTGLPGFFICSYRCLAVWKSCRCRAGHVATHTRSAAASPRRTASGWCSTRRTLCSSTRLTS
jgi:hypothetical protein